jgi:hypothetical protein
MTVVESELLNAREVLLGIQPTQRITTAATVVDHPLIRK